MKALVVYESMFGNSEKVARAIASGLNGFESVEVRDVTSAPAGVVPPDVGLLIAGGPTHALSMSRTNTREDAIRQGAVQGLARLGLREWLGALPAQLVSLPVATFDTRVSRVRGLPGSAARSAARVLHRHGAHLLLSPESFYVADVAGPLKEDELERARGWGQRVAALALQEATRHATAS